MQSLKLNSQLTWGWHSHISAELKFTLFKLRKIPEKSTKKLFWNRKINMPILFESHLCSGSCTRYWWNRKAQHSRCCRKSTANNCILFCANPCYIRPGSFHLNMLENDWAWIRPQIDSLCQRLAELVCQRSRQSLQLWFRHTSRFDAESFAQCTFRWEKGCIDLWEFSFPHCWRSSLRAFQFSDSEPQTMHFQVQNNEFCESMAVSRSTKLAWIRWMSNNILDKFPMSWIIVCSPQWHPPIDIDVAICCMDTSTFSLSTRLRIDLPPEFFSALPIHSRWMR